MCVCRVEVCVKITDAPLVFYETGGQLTYMLYVCVCVCERETEERGEYVCDDDVVDDCYITLSW